MKQFILLATLLPSIFPSVLYPGQAGPVKQSFDSDSLEAQKRGWQWVDGGFRKAQLSSARPDYSNSAGVTRSAPSVLSQHRIIPAMSALPSAPTSEQIGLQPGHPDPRQLAQFPTPEVYEPTLPQSTLSSWRVSTDMLDRRMFNKPADTKTVRAFRKPLAELEPNDFQYSVDKGLFYFSTGLDKSKNRVRILVGNKLNTGGLSTHEYTSPHVKRTSGGCTYMLNKNPPVCGCRFNYDAEKTSFTLNIDKYGDGNWIFTTRPDIGFRYAYIDTDASLRTFTTRPDSEHTRAYVQYIKGVIIGVLMNEMYLSKFTRAEVGAYYSQSIHG